MKICVVGLRGIPGVMGGVEKHCEQLYTRLATLDNRLEIQVLGRKGYLQDPPTRIDGVNVVPLWCIRNKYLEAVLHTLFAILYARVVVKADLVHIHAIGPGLFAPLARLLGMHVLFTHHGAEYQRQKWNRFARWLLRMGEKWALRWSQVAVVVSASLCETLKQRYPSQAHKLIFIPNGAEIIKTVSPDAPAHPVMTQFDLTPGHYILTVGRLVPEKGFQDLIAAHLQSASNRKLVIVGSADHPDEFSRNLLKQQRHNVVFTGFQSGDALASLYRGAALFVLPSYHEGLPISALEAMSAECPVLLSNIEPNRDIRLSPQCYFPVGDQSALADCLSAPDYEHLRADTRQILARYNWDFIAMQTLSCLKSVKQPPQAEFSHNEIGEQ